MNREIELPAPWVHVETLSPEEQDALESTVGARIAYSDLDEHDVTTTGIGKEPLSRKSWLVMGHRWNRVRNQETGETVLVRLQTFDGRSHEVSSVIFPFDPVEPGVTGARLRGFPVAAISAAYAYDEQKGLANLRTFFEILNEADSTDPLDPLPEARSTAKFSALVARQYREIESREPDVYPAERMKAINGKSLPTVQRWITQARRDGFLPPARTGRRPSNG